MDTINSTGTQQLDGRVYDFGGKEQRVVINDLIKGVRGKTILRNCPRLYIRNDAGPENTVLQDLIFDGVQVYLDQANGGMNENVQIDNCEHWNVDIGVKFTSGVRLFKITNGYFFKCGHPIYGEAYDGLTISGCEIDSCGSLHVDGKTGANLLVEQNDVRNGHGIGYEFQSTVNGVIVRDNYWRLPAAGQAAKDAGAFSLILDKSRMIYITRNVVLGNPSLYGALGQVTQVPVYAFEIGGGSNPGDQTLVEQNFVDWAYDGFIDNDKDGPSYTVVRDNRILRVGKNPPVTADVMSNNTATTGLKWDSARPVPGRNRPTTTTPGQPVPDPTPIPQPDTSAQLAALQKQVQDLQTKITNGRGFVQQAAAALV